MTQQKHKMLVGGMMEKSLQKNLFIVNLPLRRLIETTLLVAINVLYNQYDVEYSMASFALT